MCPDFFRSASILLNLNQLTFLIVVSPAAVDLTVDLQVGCRETIHGFAIANRLRSGLKKLRVTKGDEMDHRTSSTYASANLISDGSFLRECPRGFLGVDLEDLLPNSDNA